MGVGVRIKKLLELVGSNNNLVIDVGADHGILSKQILDNNQSEYVIATDISKRCLEKSEILLKGYIAKNLAKCVVSDGLKNCIDVTNCDLVIIAGMGGNEIVKILTENPNKKVFTRFLLQPMQDVEILRRFLSENGYNIVKDELIYEKGKFYFAMVVEFSDEKMNLSENEIAFGRYYASDNSKEFKDFLNYTYKQLKAREKYLSKNDLLKLSFCEKIINE